MLKSGRDQQREGIGDIKCKKESYNKVRKALFEASWALILVLPLAHHKNVS
jgi:hypothetical protein